MARSYLSQDNNGARYWPDNYPNSENSSNSTDAKKLTYSKDEARITQLLKDLFWKLNNTEKKSIAKRLKKRRETTMTLLTSHGESITDGIPVDDLDFGYNQGMGAVSQPSAPATGEASCPDNRTGFISFTFAAKAEDIDVPAMPSVTPLAADGIVQEPSIQQDSAPDQVRTLRPSENNADRDQNGQFNSAPPNNATDNTSPHNPIPRPRFIDERETSGNTSRKGNATRRYMPPRNRRPPRNDGYVSEGTLEELMRSSTSSESDSDSDMQSEQMNNGTENADEAVAKPTNGANAQVGLSTGIPTDDQNIEDIAHDVWIEHIGQRDTATGLHGFTVNQDLRDPPRVNESSRPGLDETSHAQINKADNNDKNDDDDDNDNNNSDNNSNKNDDNNNNNTQNNDKNNNNDDADSDNDNDNENDIDNDINIDNNDTMEAREAQKKPGEASFVDPLQDNEPRESNKQSGFQAIHNTDVDGAGSSSQEQPSVDPNTVPPPQLHFHYFFRLDRGTWDDSVPWTPDRRLMEMTRSQLEKSLPAQLVTASEIVLIRVSGFGEIKWKQEEFHRGDDMEFNSSMKRLKGRVEEIQEAYSHLARIDLRIEIEAGRPFMRGPPLAEREPEDIWF
ncbi:unnamed protein product [Clonostachys rosea]|uniref:Uncharacterized protein n=1 Tax=Bionectria ochroleuca TaxID=29856 RepID=A0ABY6UM98_BIOOC|nr:unnamed protein product [Clonostachys rosea]